MYFQGGSSTIGVWFWRVSRSRQCPYCLKPSSALKLTPSPPTHTFWLHLPPLLSLIPLWTYWLFCYFSNNTSCLRALELAGPSTFNVLLWAKGTVHFLIFSRLPNASILERLPLQKARPLSTHYSTLFSLLKAITSCRAYNCLLGLLPSPSFPQIISSTKGLLFWVTAGSPESMTAPGP